MKRGYSKERRFTRELSWLSFNERVLQEAHDESVPLIERIRFLGIFSNNLDEFFRVRVAAVKRMIDLGEKRNPEGIDNRKLLAKIQEKVKMLQEKFDKTFKDIYNQLRKKNVYIIDEKQVNARQKEFIYHFFNEKVQAVISPILLNNVNKMPNLKDKSIYLAVKLTSCERKIKKLFALIEIPAACPRFVELPSSGKNKYIILLDDIIRLCLSDIFSIYNFDKIEAWTIKVTRDAQFDIDNDFSKSLLEKISKGLSKRKKGQPVRFVYDFTIASDLLKYLIKRMDLDNDDNLIPGGRYHNFKNFMSFPDVGMSHLLYPQTPVAVHKLIDIKKNYFDIISIKDVMLHSPYHSFNYFINFLREASIDPKVKEIKITIYRVAHNSSVINALINALQNGKKVTVFVELQARFDEEHNIYWSKRLQEAGAKVLPGIQGIKIHGKILLISRKEKNTTRYYGCVSTGNFHERNAKVYTDLMLLTADKRITGEIAKLFSFFESTIRSYKYKHMLVAPLFMRKRIYNLIDNEIKNAKAGKQTYILLKINNIVDDEVIQKLYQANNAGVKIKLVVRGVCAIIPGVPGLSENIEAVSIVDKYLEHSRIFIFCNDDNPIHYISSADWMTRNLDWRVELACPIYDPELKKEINAIFDFAMRDNVKARIIDVTQSNKYKKDGNNRLRSQMALHNYYKRK